jgi:hypothetical protein
MMDSLTLLPLLELDVHDYRLHGAFISQTSILSIKKSRDKKIAAIDLRGVVPYTGIECCGSWLAPSR